MIDLVPVIDLVLAISLAQVINLVLAISSVRAAVYVFELGRE